MVKNVSFSMAILWPLVNDRKSFWPKYRQKFLAETEISVMPAETESGKYLFKVARMKILRIFF
jgi:hypothetical protein